MTFLLVSLIYLTGALLYAFLVARYSHYSTVDAKLSLMFIYPIALLAMTVGVAIVSLYEYFEHQEPMRELKEWWIKLCRRGRPN